MWRRGALGLVVLCVGSLGGAWACSQSSNNPPNLPDLSHDGGDASLGKDGEAADGPAVVCTFDDAGCSQLQNCAGQVYIVAVASSAPMATGGTVVDGTYVLTQYQVYTGQGGTSGKQPAWFSQTMTFTTVPTDAGTDADTDAGTDAATMQQMAWAESSEDNASPQPASAIGTAYFTSPNNLTIDLTCGGSPFVSTFSATSSELLLFVQDSTGTGELTFTKQ